MAKVVKTKNEIKAIYGLISTYHSTGHKKGIWKYRSIPNRYGNTNVPSMRSMTTMVVK